jgi:hypothetical protein
MKYILIIIVVLTCNNIVGQSTYYSTDTTIEFHSAGTRLLFRNVVTPANKVFCTLNYILNNDSTEIRFNECNFYFLHDTFIVSKNNNYLLLALASEPSDEQQYILLRISKRNISFIKFSIHYGETNHIILKSLLLNYVPHLQTEDTLLINKLTKMLDMD